MGQVGHSTTVEMRTFETGATRNVDTNKPDYEGFISPLVTKRFGEYMALHRVQADGKVRDSDNWQKGIPTSAYIKSLCRHVEDLRLHHDGYPDEATDKDIESVLSAILFNVQGYLHETIKARLAKDKATCEDIKAIRERVEVDGARYRDWIERGRPIPFETPPTSTGVPCHEEDQPAQGLGASTPRAFLPGDSSGLGIVRRHGG